MSSRWDRVNSFPYIIQYLLVCHITLIRIYTTRWKLTIFSLSSGYVIIIEFLTRKNNVE